MKKQSLPLFAYSCIASLAIFATSASGQTLAVDFGADYTSNNINNSTPAGSGPATGDYDFDGSSDDRAYIIPFGSEASVTSSSNWTTPAGKSGATINYGISVANIDSSTDPDVNLNRITSGDVIQATNDAGTSDMRMASAWYWEKASFVNGQDTAGNLSFANSASSMTVDINNSGPKRKSRLLAQSGGSWYLSEDFSTAATGTLNINASTANWYSFDPSANALFWDVNNPGSTVTGSTLTDITALGVYAQHELFDGTSQNAAIQGFNSLQATVIPEPSSMALFMAGTVALALGLLRMRGKRD